uniref:Uncharacterized protein n=1 Tax=Nelumbo nucifera TaxID=4432 RepID=A0A822XDU6_NELNU|nr:TPA_asm: hypothetical protein HUJ06_021087 [Nelumbo nucifera]
MASNNVKLMMIVRVRTYRRWVDIAGGMLLSSA